MNRLGVLLEQELTKPLGDRSLNNSAAEVRALMRVFREVPVNVAFASGPLRRAFDQLETKLAAAIDETALAAENSLANLLQLLEAGTLHAEYGRRFNFELPVNWETTRLPLLVTRFATLAQQQQGWSELNEASRLLLNTADRLGLANNQSARKANLEQAAALLTAERSAARAMIQSQGGLLQLVDMVLPGDIRVDNVAGSVRHHRFTGDFEGAFRGALQLPKFGTALTINNASFNRGGAFDINAFGQLRAPATNTVLTAIIPQLQPLHLSWNSATGLRLSGAANFTLANGMFFKGSIGLEDPIYRFRLEAGGLEMQLARALVPNLPRLPAQTDFNRNGQFDEQGLQLWANMLGSVSDLHESLGTAAPTPVDVAGVRSDFTEETAADPALASLNTWSDLAAIAGHNQTPALLIPTIQPASDLIHVRALAHQSEIREFAEVVQEVTQTPANPPPAGPPPVTPPPELGKALQIDFGRTDDPAPSTAPAQSFGRDATGTQANDIFFSDQPGRWNFIGQQDATSNLFFADNTAATGVTVDLGLSPAPDSTFIEFFRNPEAILAIAPENRRTGIYSTTLMTDAVGGIRPGVGAPGAFGVRVGGLAPGFYYVLGMITAQQESAGLFAVFSGSSAVSVEDFEGRAVERPVTGELITNWSEGRNFTLGRASLTAPGQDLLVISKARRLPGATRTPHGELSGLQIVAPKVKLLSFSADTNRVQLGQRVRLRWSTRHAQKLIITGTDGFRSEIDATRELSDGQIEVEPPAFTTYTLTATNQNGPALSSSITVIVEGPQATRKAASVAIKKQKQIMDKARKALDEAARCALRGEANCPAPNAAICADIKEFLNGLRRTLFDCNAITSSTSSPDTLIQAAFDAIELGVGASAEQQTGGCDTTAEDFGLGEIAAFADCIATDFQRRTGLTTSPGSNNTVNQQLNLPLIKSFAVTESARFIRQLLNLSASVAAIGGNFSPPEIYIEAHGTNILERINAAAATPQAAANLTESELAAFVDGIEVLRALIGQGFDARTPSNTTINNIVAALLFKTEEEFNYFEGLLGGIRQLADPRFWQRQFISVRDAALLNDFTGDAVQRPLVRERALKVIRAIADGSTFSPELRPQDVQALAFLTRFLPDADFRTAYSKRVTDALRFIKDQVPPGTIWNADQLRTGAKLVGQLADLQLLLDLAKQSNAAITLSDDLQPLALGNRVIAYAEVAARDTKALNLTMDFVRAIFDARRKLKLRQLDLPEDSSSAPPALAAAGLHAVAPPDDTQRLSDSMLQTGFVVIKAADDLAAENAQRFNQAPTNSLPSDLALPASLRVERVFGELFYNRQTGFLKGGFGGALSLPDSGFSIAINQATVASDGSFSIDAATSSPLPLGNASLNVAGALNFSPRTGIDFLGSGQLFLPVPGTTTVQIHEGTVNYDQDAQSFGFTSLARNLNLPFSDDFALLDAGYGLQFARGIQEGKFFVTGSAGLLAKSKPLPASFTRTNFQMVAENITTSFSYTTNTTAILLENGTLHLPSHFTTAICPTNQPGGVSGPAIAITPAAPLGVTIRQNPLSTSFSGEFNFRNLGFQVPGLTNLAVEVCSAKLIFPTNQFPRLTNLNATVQLPIPGQTNRVDLAEAAFSLDGFPTGAISLRDNLTLFSSGGFDFTLLGTVTTNCATPTALTIARQPNGQPFFRLDGGLEFGVPPSVLGNTNGGRLFTRSCGFLTAAPNQPLQLGMENFAVGGTIRLGGPQGLLIENAVLALDGLTNIYNPSLNQPFSVTLGGFVNIPGGPRLGLQDARFSFVGETLPRFTIAGMSIAQNPDYELAPGLLLNVTAASIVFLDPNRPFPQVIAPDNIELGLSAQVNIPPGPTPILSGRVDNLRARLVDGRIQTQISGFGVGIQNLEFPPLTLTGEVFLGGLDTVSQPAALQGLIEGNAAGRPPGLFFAGRVGGTLNGIGIKALIAFDLNGPIGVCLDASAGPAGIPLGPTGFLLTGAAGGVSFLNSNGDPCDFSTFYPVGADGRPQAVPQSIARQRPGAAMTWDEYERYLQRAKLNAQYTRQIADAVERRSRIAPQNRVPDSLSAQTSSLSARLTGGEGRGEVGSEAAGKSASSLSRPSDTLSPSDGERAGVRGFGDDKGNFNNPLSNTVALAAAEPPAFPCPTGDCPPPTVNILCQPHPDFGQFPNKVIIKFSSLDEKTVNDFGVTRQFVSGLGLTDALGIGQSVAGNIRRGIDPLIPRADPGLLGQQQAQEINNGITQFLDNFESTFAQIIRQSIAPFLGSTTSVYDKILEIAYAGAPCPDATVKLTGTFSHAAVSTALSATGGVVLSTTGAAGVVGSINLLGVPVGRTESYVAGTDNRGDPNPSFCGESLLTIGPIEFGQMKSKFECPGCVTGVLGAFGQLAGCLADETIRAILARVAPQHLNKTTQQALAALTDPEKLAFIGQILSMPPVPGFSDCFAASARSAVDSFNPSFTLCGAVVPKIFGIPLSAELVEVNASATRTNIAARFAFSPSYVINNLMLCAGSAGLFCQPIFPALDSASMGFGLGFPDFAEAAVGGFEGKFNSPAAIADFAKDGFDNMLANATYTIGYEINPFGFKLASAEARVILPNLTEHPARPGFSYVRPEDRGQNFPSRLNVALTALESGFLANPLWKGTVEDLPTIFPQGSAERTKLQQSSLSFQKDYFPHGGILGAARLALPKLIVDAPPPTLTTVLDPSQDVFARLGAAADVIGNFLLQTSEVGTLAFYVPAPNPPFFTDGAGNALTPPRMLEAIQTFDVSKIGLQSLYPLEQFFFSGYMEGRLVGVPIARADIVAVPASASSGAFFRVSAGVPGNSWLKSFVDSANMTFEIRQSPPQPIEEVFQDLMDDVIALNRPGSRQADVANLVNEISTKLTDGLPKVSLDIAVNNFRVPDPLTNLLTSASTSVRLVAYSPRFNPDFPGTGPLAEVTRRGGIAFKSSFNFANLVTINNAELAVFPSDIASLPNLSGRFSVPQLGFPNMALKNATFDFNSIPAAGAPFLAAAGTIDPIRINNPLNGDRLLSFVPLAANARVINARLSMIRAANNSIQGSFSIDPARIDMPMLGNGLTARIHGATTNDPFSFSTTGPWTASASIVGQFSIRNPAGAEILRIGSSGGNFSASASGNGFALSSLIVSNIPTGLTITSYPGTAFTQSFTIGGITPAQLRINGDGTFSFTAELGGELNLPGLPVPSLRAGASITINEQQLQFTGSFQGGLLGAGANAQGTFTLTGGGIPTLTGSATIPPQAFGSILIRGVSSDNLTVQLFHDGYAVANGARLQVVGVNSDLLTLSPFTNRANQNFTATVSSANFSVPNHFQMTSSQMKFQRASGVVSLEINSPTLTLMPGSQNQTVLTAPFPRVIVGTDGRFYANSGVKAINLLGGVKLQGRLEIGNEPSAAVPGLTIAPLTFNYGVIDFGTISNKTVRISNTGDAPLIVNLSSSSPAFIPAQTDLSIPVGEFRDVGMQFRPTASGVIKGQIQVFMAPGGQQPPVTLTGDARPVPIFDASASTLGFGDVPLGTSRTRTLIIRNLGVAPLVLTSGAITGPFTISPAISKRNLQPGERADFTVTFTPVALGAASGDLTIPANDSATAHSIELQTGNAYAERMVRMREGGPTLRSIAMISTNTGWAVGDDGAFLRTDNGGRSWLTVRAPFSGSFRAVAARNSLVVVAGLDGMAGVSTDAGLSWRRLSLSPVAAAGNHWTSVALLPLPVLTIGNLDLATKVVLAGFNDAGGGIILREEGGVFVQALAPASPINAIAGSPLSPALPPRVIAVGDSGIVVRSTDAGVTWTTTTLQGGFTHLRGVASGGTSPVDTEPDVWIAGDSGTLFIAGSLSGNFTRVFGPTLENFTALRVGYIVGENGSAYSRLPIVSNSPLVRDNPTGAYDFTSLTANTSGTWLAGQFGQVYFRPNTAPAGPFITFAPGEADFSLLPLGRTRNIEVTVFNRGFAPLNVTGMTLTGSSAFSLSAATLLNIATNSSKTFLVRFTPTTKGDHAGVIEFTHNESAVKYRLPLRGRGQVNTWNLLASPTPQALRDIQFVSDSTGFAATLDNVFKTTNGGTNWTQTSAAPPSNISRIHFFSSALGFAFGGEAGRLFPTCTGTCNSYILRTADGGATWSLRNSSVTTAVDDLHMTSLTTGFAVTRSTSPRVGRATAGDVLRTTDGGLTWVARGRPSPLSGVFSGSAVHAVSSTVVFAAGNGELHRSTDGGGTWTRVLNLGAIIEDIQFFDANNGWIVGQDGAFRRTTTGGTISTAWTPQTSFTSIDLRRVHFINLNTGWTAGFDGVAGGVFRTDNGGTTWVQEYQENLSAGAVGPSSVSGRSASVAFAVNRDGVYKSGPFNPVLQGSPTLPSLVDFGVVSFGVNASSTITLRNVGSATVNVTSLALDDDDETGAFELLTALPIAVPANGSRQISVRYSSPTVARHHATLLVATDGYEGTLRCDLVGEAQVFPTTLVFETDPPGLNIKLDQFTARGPRSVTVVGEPKVPNDVINPFEWRFGTTHTVTAPATQVNNGFEYRFQRWEPSQPEVFTILATNVPSTYRAVYVQAKPVEPLVGGAIPGHRSNRAIGLQGLHAAGGPPSDVPSGPYIRISQAELQLPSLGNVGVQGSAFLSSDRFSLALASDPIGNPQLLSVDAGSWLVSFTNNVRFVLRAQNPAITLLNRPATASSQVLFDVSATRIVAQLNLSGTATTPIIPAVVELGPGTTVAFTNAVSGVTRFSSFRTSGDLRLLAKPGGGFAITQAFNFRASDGPFTNSITSFPSTILDTPLLRITPATSPRIEIRRDGNGVFGVLVNNFNLSLLGGANTQVSGSVVGTKMNFTAGSTIALGSLQYNAQSPSSLEWDFSGPSFKVTVASGTLTVPGISQGLSFGSGFTIDTDASFSKKIALPSLTFDGIGVSGGGPLDHNFVRFFREDGVAGFELRDRRSFFDNTFKLAINITSSGAASGTFKGNLVIKDFLGCDEIGIPDLRLTYNSGFDDFQFRDDVSLETCLFGRHDFRVRFGTAGAKFCHLICGPDGCVEDLCLP